MGVKSTYGRTLSIFQESTDAGQTWSNDFESAVKLVSKSGFAALLSLGVSSN